MHRVVLLALGTAPLFLISSPAAADPYEDYLGRLKDVCTVDCLEPRDFRRKARKRDAADKSDMAVMMDVRDVRRDGEKYLLLSEDLRLSNLETLAVLGGAGIDVSGRTGIGGLPRGSAAPTNPDLIMIELDEQTVADLLRMPVGSSVPRAQPDDAADILVEGEAGREKRGPTIAELNNSFINRRIVVRGSTRLQPTWVGGRRDFRRKQVTLEVDNADDLALLPRYDDEGKAILDGRLESELTGREPSSDEE